MLDPNRWYPVAGAAELPHGHIYQTMLGGAPLAIWRDADGRVNIWEDRCPHRGVRFSIGSVVGNELRCQYHGWRFASGSGGCTLIPAQPDRKVPGAIRAAPHPMAEAGGMIWTGLQPTGVPDAPAADTLLRPILVDQPAPAIEPALAEIEGARFVVQPLDGGRCMVRGWTSAALLRDVDAGVEAWRWRVEAA